MIVTIAPLLAGLGLFFSGVHLISANPTRSPEGDFGAAGIIEKRRAMPIPLWGTDRPMRPGSGVHTSWALWEIAGMQSDLQV